MGRDITKDKYHNNREDEDKKRRNNLDEVQTNIDKLRDEIFSL